MGLFHRWGKMNKHFEMKILDNMSGKIIDNVHRDTIIEISSAIKSFMENKEDDYLVHISFIIEINKERTGY